MNRASDWKTYAAATGATLAMAANASAEIMNSGPVDITVSVPFSGNASSHQIFTINGNSVLLNINNFTATALPFRVASAAIFGKLGLAATFTYGGSQAARRYKAGSSITTGSSRSNTGFLRSAARFGGVTSRTIGAFGPGTVTGFVGFETFHGDLGWMQVKVSDRNSDGFPDEAEVIDFAYNTIPGAPINAGQMVATPEPGAAALGLLTIGAAGLLAWRRRRAEVASK